VRGGRGGVAAPSITLGIGPSASDAKATETTGAGTGDAFGLDEKFRDRVLPFFRLLHDRYWRVEVTGARNVPAEGPALLVSNHSGALPFDGAMICTAVDTERGRRLRFLYDRFVESLGPVATFYRKVGGVAASRESAVELLQAGEMVLLFPEGVPGVAKDFNDRYRLRPFSPGFARLALALDVPIIPVAVVGAEEIYPVVGRVEAAGRLLGMPYVPLTPFFPLLGPLGVLPLPTKWFIRFGKPIRLPPADGEARWQRARAEAVRVRRTVQSMVRRLRAQRRSVFFG
jgi:1-acyl-sn-glycerol-3-phosphate acyltransferase